nr:hypothetical protein Iba_chr07bCG2270 [Ipomoea batatas]GMD15713.1 hypothetical protein Iba_chr07cCG2400 [Ipomoea batatas]GMD20226.1 hypothetical protein Iba_chr07fCG2850 [Ipomoea batatas]
MLQIVQMALSMLNLLRPWTMMMVYPTKQLVAPLDSSLNKLPRPWIRFLQTLLLSRYTRTSVFSARLEIISSRS